MAKLAAFLILALASGAVQSGGVSELMLKKLGLRLLGDVCFGAENSRNYLQAVKGSIKKCQGLTPTFEFQIFENNDNNKNNYEQNLFNQFVKNNENNGLNQFTGNPFKRFNTKQESVQQAANVDITNPYQAWLAFLAFQKAQKQAGSARRFTRDTLTAEDLSEFSRDVSEYKMLKKDKLGNLTCVLADIGILDANLNINMDFYTNQMWKGLPNPVNEDVKRKYIESVKDCSEIANSIPQSVLNKNPLYKQFGRQMIFMKCENKAKITVCTKHAIKKYMEETYGDFSIGMLQGLGLPEDEFDAAFMAKQVKMNSLTEPEKLVYDFVFFGKPN